eukprot:PLAT11645.1.p2 GENE.PLAT11645.1~~PLAT11645.1.p2  ORF type:complete len:280 (+),score=132.54 PLAT11645.1:29-841(+)
MADESVPPPPPPKDDVDSLTDAEREELAAKASAAAAAAGEVKEDDVPPPPPPADRVFDPELLFASLDECKAGLDGEKGDVPTRPFLTACTEIAKMVRSLGTAFGFASSDIEHKIEVMKTRMTEEATARGDPEDWLDLLAAVQKNIDDGACYTCRSPENVARTLLRLLWFLDFVYLFTNKMTAEPDEKLYVCAKEAYWGSIYPFHNFLVRATVSAALNFTPTRETFATTVSRGSMTPDEVPSRMRTLADKVVVVKDPLRQFFKDNDINDVP